MLLGVGDRPHGRFATHAGFLLQDGSPYREGYTYAAEVWALSMVQGTFSVTPCPTLMLRFATFASLRVADYPSTCVSLRRNYVVRRNTLRG